MLLTLLLREVEGGNGIIVRTPMVALRATFVVGLVVYDAGREGLDRVGERQVLDAIVDPNEEFEVRRSFQSVYLQR